MKKKILKLLLLVVGLYAALRVLLPSINSPYFRSYVEAAGVWGYTVVVGYTVLSHVIAPIAGSPGVALGVAVYGIQTGSWLLYIGSMISATINFWISKRWGREWVKKLAGSDAMGQVDEFASSEGKTTLFFTRIFGFSLFDFVSYAAGLTSISYRDYMVATAIGSLIPNLIMQYVFRNTDFGSEEGVLIWGVSIMTMAILFGVALKIYRSSRK